MDFDELSRVAKSESMIQCPNDRMAKAAAPAPIAASFIQTFKHLNIQTFKHLRHSGLVLVSPFGFRVSPNGVSGFAFGASGVAFVPRLA
jgi:hypothetical protein